jgi:hypothetical protein
MNAITSFFMWIKFMYYLRLFRSTSKFITMLIQVFIDIQVFMFVFIIALISCGQSMWVLSNNAEKANGKFVTGPFFAIMYMYRLSLGEISMDEMNALDSYLVIATFLIGTLFLTVVMLNILVAVISDTYA